MKIAFIFPPIWPLHVDGSLQIWNREMTARLSRICEVTVYHASFSTDGHDGADGIADDGVTYRCLSTHWDSRLLKYFQLFYHAVRLKKPPFASDFWYPWYAFRAALDIRKRVCDIVHVYNYPQFCPIIKCCNPKIRVVLNMHGELLTQVSFRNIYYRLRRVDAVISCSEFVSRAIRAKFPAIASRCKTVPMGISTDALSTNKHLASDNSSPRRLLYVGRVSPEKGVHVLLEAFEIILRRHPDASLTIVGPGWIPPREYLADLCLDRSVVEGFAHFYEGSYTEKLKDNLSPEAAKRVTFAGLIPHRDVPNYYANADIFISPSFYESFGMSVIEAMAAGLPVVAVGGGALPDLISDGSNGLLVGPANPGALARSVEKLITNHELRKSIARKAREMVCKTFSFESDCSRLLEVYQDVLSCPFDSQEAETSGQISSFRC